MISLNPSGFCCSYDEKNIENLTQEKGGKKTFSNSRTRKARFYNVIACLHFYNEIKTFWTFTIPEKQENYEITDKYFTSCFSQLLEGLRKRYDRGSTNGLENFVWVSEAQGRGNIHFHLVTSTKFIDVKFVNDYWCKIIGQYSANAVDVQNLKKIYYDSSGKKVDNRIRNISAYFSKYMVKSHCKEDEGDLKGRVIFAKFFNYSRNFPIMEKIAIHPKKLDLLIPNLKDKKVTKKFDGFEVDYYFIDTFQALQIIFEENKKLEDRDH